MELVVGPFDPALYIRSRDHYEAVRREAQLLALQPDAPPRQLEALLDHLSRQFPANPVDDIADRAFLAGEPTFTARLTVPDELVATALEACDRLEALFDELDRWARTIGVELLEAPADIKAYRRAYLAQSRAQLRTAQARLARVEQDRS